MMLWIIFAVMTAAAVFAVLWPLGRKADAVGGGSDRLVYQDQLEEIDRDRAAGLIGEAEAEVGAYRDIASAAGCGGRRGAGCGRVQHFGAFGIAALRRLPRSS